MFVHQSPKIRTIAKFSRKKDLNFQQIRMERIRSSLILVPLAAPGPIHRWALTEGSVIHISFSEPRLWSGRRVTTSILLSLV
jgi:hypothetical protein